MHSLRKQRPIKYLPRSPLARGTQREKMTRKKHGLNTTLMHLGRDPDEYYGIVNPPIVRASSILFPSLEEYENKDRKFRYARYGTPLSDKFEKAMTELEGGYAAVTVPSGLAAISLSMLAMLKSGDHVLVTDSIYPPARQFCNNTLSRMGVEVEYYDPRLGAGIETRIKANTRVIYMESPGSATFDVQDVPAIVAAAKKKYVFTIVDNSWSAGLLFQPFRHGADVVIQSVTKYVGGHSDIMLGVAIGGTEEVYTKLKATAMDLGICAGSEDIYLALRGLRTLPLRLKQCAANAMEVAKWLVKRPEIQKIYYPALADHPDHKIWKRDFTGANGLLGVLLKPAPKAKLAAFVDSLELFPIGSSWGGYESLLQPQYLIHSRSAVPWTEEGMLLRLQIGLEDPEDLIADLEQGFRNLK